MVEIVPVLVVEMVPVLVVEIVPLLERPIVDTAKIKSIAQKVHFKVFIGLLLVLKLKGGHRSKSPPAEHFLGSTITKSSFAMVHVKACAKRHEGGFQP